MPVLLAVLTLLSAAADGQTNGIFADFETSLGCFTCRLEPGLAPKATAHFVGLATGQCAWLDWHSGSAKFTSYYDGLTFTRVVPGTLIQAGFARGPTNSGVGYVLREEFDPPLSFDAPAVLALANTGPNSTGPEFFVTLTNQPDFDGKYTILGRVTEGWDAVKAIGQIPVAGTSTPLTNVRIQHITIRRVGTEAEAFDIHAQGLPLGTNVPLAVQVEAAGVALQFSNRLFANNLLFSSTNLATWTCRNLGIGLSLPLQSSLTLPVAEQAQFFRLAQVRYPSTTLAPPALAGQSLWLHFSDGSTVVLTFHADGSASYAGPGGDVPLTYLWRQEPYRGFLGPINLPGRPPLTLRLDFADDGCGEFQDTVSAVSGAFSLAPIGLEGSWSLDGSWHDAVGGHDLTPLTNGGFGFAPQLRPGTNGCYGPTHADNGNGAFSLTFTNLPEDHGLTLEGWVSLPDNGASGLLFGFGNASWNQPTLSVTAGWGFIWVRMGRRNDGAVVEYPRIGDTCWHHLALVLPAGFRQGTPFRFYLDGVETPNIGIDSSRSGGAWLTPDATLFGAPFGIGDFNEGFIKIDEVRVWSRELSGVEIAAAAHPTGVGNLCENSPPPNWAPGPRFVAPTNEPPRTLTLGAHVLTDDTVAIITDPNPFLKQRLVADCGLYLHAMETNRQYLPAWMPAAEYNLATWEVIIHYRPGIFAALCGTNHFQLSGPDYTNGPVATISLWPQATREFRTPSLADGGGDLHSDSSENVYFSYLKLPFHMTPGGTYQITDAWSNSVSWVYDENQTLSWALKVNQLGYLPDAPEKYAYLGSWLGAAGGALDVDRFDGQSFSVCNETNGEAVFTNTITFRGDESAPTNGVILSGEKVYQLDFSAFATPGRYYIRVPGVGRSWSFELGQNALGEAFYAYSRSLYHQRCGTVLTTNYTAWPRGDAHTNTYTCLVPTEPDALSDHSAEGWGLLDAAGHFPTNFASGFQIIANTATTNLVPGLRGGWHDAGDYDRGSSHLRVVEDFVESYLMFPDNFTDGQAHIPESGNGLPDLLDEAVWGVEVWRRAQEPDGRVALTIEATSHPQIPDPNIDTEPYYLGLATHNSSLLYSQHAARLARGLAHAGDTNQAELFLESARRAYEFAIADGPRISVTIPDPGGDFSWTEPPQISPGERSKALVQLWLASGDTNYYAQLTSTQGFAGFKGELDSMYWRTVAFDFVDVGLAPEKFPDGWGELVRTAITNNADGWLAWQQAHAYRALWYAPGEGYFPLMGWGNNDFMYVRNLVAAWRLTGDARYRAAALTCVDWMHGANPQGRVNTTGLGQNFVVNPLHDPSDTDGLAEPVPGISIYGYTFGILYHARTEVCGLFASPNHGANFDGAALAQLPPPWNDTSLTLPQIADILYAHMPVWHNLWALEAANPQQMEFTIPETQSPAAAVTGCLMGPGWQPSAALLNRQPRTEVQLQDSRWFHP